MIRIIAHENAITIQVATSEHQYQRTYLDFEQCAKAALSCLAQPDGTRGWADNEADDYWIEPDTFGVRHGYYNVLDADSIQDILNWDITSVWNHQEVTKWHDINGFKDALISRQNEILQ